MDQRISLQIKTFHFTILQIPYFLTKVGMKSHQLDLEFLTAVGGNFQGKKKHAIR